jgi:hypothetical protein
VSAIPARVSGVPTARARLRTTQGPRRAPAFDPLGLAAGAGGRAARQVAVRFVQPVLPTTAGTGRR